MLPTILLLLAVLLVTGLAFLGSCVLENQASAAAIYSQQALALAEAGMEDARLKLQKDLLFPPGSEDQMIFSYVEELPSPVSALAGSYQVTIDKSHRDPPYQVIVVTACGYLGPRDRPLGRRKLSAEYDLGPSRASLGHYLHWVDGGDL
ncbi:MAG: hypothetical protein U0931_15550 [Vulcanimicrobiota bacterium]